MIEKSASISIAFAPMAMLGQPPNVPTASTAVTLTAQIAAQLSARYRR
jgi:hypothetical protein